MAGNNGSWARSAPYLLSVLRIIAAFLLMQHGANKLFNFPSDSGGFELISSAHLMTLHPGLAGILEFGGGFFLLIGLFSRPIAFVLSGEMAFAYFMVHVHGGFWPFLNHGGMAVLFCFTFLYLSAAGPGPWSVDRALRRA